MSDLRPKWAIILDELIEMAEPELKEVEKGAVPTAQKHKTTHPKKERGNPPYD
jgi:hypothetical protein